VTAPPLFTPLLNRSQPYKSTGESRNTYRGEREIYRPRIYIGAGNLHRIKALTPVQEWGQSWGRLGGEMPENYTFKKIRKRQWRGGNPNLQASTGVRPFFGIFTKAPFPDVARPSLRVRNPKVRPYNTGTCKRIRASLSNPYPSSGRTLPFLDGVCIRLSDCGLGLLASRRERKFLWENECLREKRGWGVGGTPREVAHGRSFPRSTAIFRSFPEFSFFPELYVFTIPLGGFADACR
jgi:hypothetical protein